MRYNPFKIQEGSVKDARVSGFFRDRQSGDYLNFDYFGRSDHLGRYLTPEKIKISFYLFSLVFLILLSRAFYLQIIKGNQFRATAEGNRIYAETIKANRGIIYDRFGIPLVKNTSYFFLYLIKDRIPEEENAKSALLAHLAQVLQVDVGDLKSKLEQSKKNQPEVLVFENVPYETALSLMVESDEEPAIHISFEPRRLYFSEYGLSSVLGYLGQLTEEELKQKETYGVNDRIGKSGIEAVYEDTLRGKDGDIQYEVDALFRKKELLGKVDSQEGRSINLTIDSKAQKKLFEIMQEEAKSTGKDKMAAVVLNPKNGEILAMTSLPTYDNNIFTSVLNSENYSKIIEDPNKPLLNRVISGAYPLGSVFKLVVSAAALQEKIINDKFRVQSVGGVTVGNRFFPDWRPQGHGWTDIYWALADSVNTFFYSIGGGNNEWLSNGLGMEKIIDYAKQFGFAKETGIDLTGEVSGFLPSKEWKEKNLGERWYLGDTYNLSIGQGFLNVTPMQAAQLMSYFANNGTAYQPHLLKSTGLELDKKEYSSPIALTNLISSDNLSIIRQGLRLTVTKGTAQSLQSVKVPVAGKTGTAQFRQDKTPHSWFAAFAPYDDPQIVVTVLVEEGGDQGWAVRVVRRFMEWYFEDK